MCIQKLLENCSNRIAISYKTIDSAPKSVLPTETWKKIAAGGFLGTILLVAYFVSRNWSTGNSLDFLTLIPAVSSEPIGGQGQGESFFNPFSNLGIIGDILESKMTDGQIDLNPFSQEIEAGSCDADEVVLNEKTGLDAEETNFSGIVTKELVAVSLMGVLGTVGCLSWCDSRKTAEGTQATKARLSIQTSPDENDTANLDSALEDATESSRHDEIKQKRDYSKGLVRKRERSDSKAAQNDTASILGEDPLSSNATWVERLRIFAQKALGSRGFRTLVAQSKVSAPVLNHKPQYVWKGLGYFSPRQFSQEFHVSEEGLTQLIATMDESEQTRLGIERAQKVGVQTFALVDAAKIQEAENGKYMIDPTKKDEILSRLPEAHKNLPPRPKYDPYAKHRNGDNSIF